MWYVFFFLFRRINTIQRENERQLDIKENFVLFAHIYLKFEII